MGWLDKPLSVTMLDRAVAKGNSVWMSIVRPSVCLSHLRSMLNIKVSKYILHPVVERCF